MSAVAGRPTASARPAPIIVDQSTLRGRALVPVLLYVGLMVAIVSSLGAPLIPTISADYGVSLGTAQWSLTITLLVGAIASPIIGRLGDGPRRLHVLLASLAVVVIGSMLAALPTKTFALLILGRAMQGIGLALLPLAMSIARDHLNPDRARATLATLSVTAVVGVGLGYPLTGLIAEHLGFHAGFWVAAGLGAIALAASAMVVPTSMHRASQPFDLVGAGLLAVALAALLLGVSEGEEWGWTSVREIAALVVAVIVLAVWVRYELSAQGPLVDLRQLRQRTVLTADVTGLLAGIGMYMLMSMIIRYVQTPTSTSYGLGASVVVAGLVLLPLSAASFVSSHAVGYLTRFIAPGRILPIGAILFVCALMLFANYRAHLWQILIEMGVAGMAIGCSFAVMPRLIVTAVEPSETSSALALNQVLRTIGYSIGSALGATILTAHTPAGQLLPSNGGYTDGAIVGVGLCLLTAVLSFALLSRNARPNGPMTAEQNLLVEESEDSAIAGLIEFEPAELPVRR